MLLLLKRLSFIVFFFFNHLTNEPYVRIKKMSFVLTEPNLLCVFMNKEKVVNVTNKDIYIHLNECVGNVRGRHFNLN